MNICNLSSFRTQCIEIDSHSINQYLLSELEYSYYYWVQHLIKSKDPITKIGGIFLFLQEYFLYWVEAMSILGNIFKVVRTINTL